MAKYRKRPVVIEAWQVPTGLNALEIMEAVPSEFIEAAELCGTDEGIQVPTLEGTMLARPGDWLIIGVKGEIYPCKADIFAATYEAVE